MGVRPDRGGRGEKDSTVRGPGRILNFRAVSGIRAGGAGAIMSTRRHYLPAVVLCLGLAFGPAGADSLRPYDKYGADDSYSGRPARLDTSHPIWKAVPDMVKDDVAGELGQGANFAGATGVEGTTVESLWQAYMLPIDGWRAMVKSAGLRTSKPKRQPGLT
jgi:hypothetical protein